MPQKPFSHAQRYSLVHMMKQNMRGERDEGSCTRHASENAELPNAVSQCEWHACMQLDFQHSSLLLSRAGPRTHPPTQHHRARAILRLIMSYTRGYGYPYPRVSMFQNPYLDSPGFQEPGTYTMGIQEPGTWYPRVFRHSQAQSEQTLVYSSYGKLLVHSMIYYVIYQIYAAICCSMQLHICSRFAYIMSTFLKWYICIINQL